MAWQREGQVKRKQISNALLIFNYLSTCGCLSSCAYPRGERGLLGVSSCKDSWSRLMQMCIVPQLDLLRSQLGGSQEFDPPRQGVLPECAPPGEFSIIKTWLKLKTGVGSNGKISCFGTGKIWQILQGRSPQKLCCSSHEWVILTNVATFKREINGLSVSVRLIAKNHCDDRETIQIQTNLLTLCA